MRPVPTQADASASRGFARAADSDVLPPNPPVAPLSCFITTEAGLDSLEYPPELDHRSKAQVYAPSLAPSLSLSDQSTRRTRPASLFSLSDMDYAFSQPSTPIPADALGPQSAISGSSSPGFSSSRSLLEDINGHPAGSAAVSPSRGPCRGPADSVTGSTVPQLVMPRLKIPYRRSFSEVGKSIGRLNLLVAGRAGIGKTSLIQALGRNCQDIVHMDPLESCSVGKVREIYASSRPDPWWRASSREPVAYAKKQRQSLTDEILDRNLCFLDCPALPDGTEADRYIQTQLLRLCDKPLEDEDLFHILSGGAGSIVHAVLYMLPSTGPSPVDIRCIKSLQGTTNVIPLLARADELGSEDSALCKDKLVNMLGDEGLEWFSFARPESTERTASIYAVSSAAPPGGPPADTSIHLSFEILQPRVSADVEELIGHIFSVDGSSRLRYSAALKSVSWRRRYILESTSQFALTSQGLITGGALVPHTGTNLYFERRQWERIELSSWAESLQHSLAAERTDRWRRIPGPSRGCDMRMTRTGCYAGLDQEQTDGEPVNPNHQDPLGLLKLGSQIKHGGRLTLELMGSLGVIGCIAMWLIRPEIARHWDTGLPPPWCLIRF